MGVLEKLRNSCLWSSAVHNSWGVRRKDLIWGKKLGHANLVTQSNSAADNGPILDLETAADLELAPGPCNSRVKANSESLSSTSCQYTPQLDPKRLLLLPLPQIYQLLRMSDSGDALESNNKNETGVAAARTG